MKVKVTLLAIILLLCASELSAYGKEQEDQQNSTVVVVIGAAGTEEYAVQFAEQARLWQQACSKGNTKFIVIGLDKVESSSDRIILQKTLTNESKKTIAALWLILIGHGTFDGRTAKFNLRGPDISADELSEWLKPMARPIAIINTASSSAPFLSKLSANGRVVITATKSGFEQNYTRFGQYLVGAIIKPQADLDKDGQTSLLEAFLFASDGVTDFYSAAGKLITEHALIEDNGDGLGTRADWFRGIRPVQKAQGGILLDGYRAHQFHLVYSDFENKISPDLRAKRDQLELEVMKLRDTKGNFSEEEYFSKLEALLYNIAQIYEQIDKNDNTQK